MTSQNTIANTSRFIPIPDLRVWYPHLAFSGCAQLVTDGEPLLLTDPIYLADVYNNNDDPVARYLRQHAVIVNDFGGDTTCPVWWKDPFLVMPTSHHIVDGIDLPPHDARIIVTEAGCDSGSFAFLRMRSDLPEALIDKAEVAVRQRNGALLDVPAGLYSFWLEQFEYPDKMRAEWYRNIVAERATAVR